MTNACTKWKSMLLDAALAGAPPGSLEAHLAECDACSRELARLRAKRTQLDTLLPLVAREAEPHPEFHARVLAAAETARRTTVQRRFWIPAFGAAAAAVLAAVMIMHKPSSPPLTGPEREAATALANWRAPSDVLLETPGRDLMRTTPRLGESYINFAMKPNKEK